MIGKGATPSFFAIANDNYTLTYQAVKVYYLIKNISIANINKPEIPVKL